MSLALTLVAGGPHALAVASRLAASAVAATGAVVKEPTPLGPGALDWSIEAGDRAAIRAAVEAGAGVAVLSRLVVARALKAGDLVELALELPDRAFHALRHKERYRTRAADALTDLIKEQVA